MTSLVESLGARLREIGQDLPLTELNRASARLRSATERCGQVMQESGHADWLGELAAASEHLDHAIAATTSVLAGLDGYLTGIGLAGLPHPEPGTPAAGPTPSVSAGTTQRADPALAMRTWWVERVDILTGRPPDPRRPATHRTDGARPGTPEDPPETLRRLVHAARQSGPDGYRQQLLATHPASGLQVPAPAARALRYLVTDLLGHPPGPADHRRVRDRAAGRVRELLPAAPEALADTLVADVCGVGGRDRAERHHPVDAAASWPILVGAVLAALGRDEAELVRLTAVAQQQPDDTVRRDGR